MRHRRIVRRTMGKDAIKKGTTLIDNIGSGSPITVLDIASVQARSTTGAGQVIRDNQTTGADANVGDVLKYVNLCIEIANRDTNVEPADSGWLEYAVTFEKETSTPIPVTNIGTLSLPVIATRMFRGDCLWTGCIPVGAIQPMVSDIPIKIPKNKIKFQLGSALKLHMYFRSTDSTDMRTDSCRLVASALFKLYV